MRIGGGCMPHGRMVDWRHGPQCVAGVRVGGLGMVLRAMPHRRVVHACRRRTGAVTGVVHAHVRHRAQRALAQRRHGGHHAQARRQRAGRVATAVHGFGKHRVGAILQRGDDDVVGLGHGDLQLVGLDRLHVLAVGLHHRHRQTRNAQVEVGHRRRVDEAQAHPLTGTEQAGPVAGRVLAVHQVRVGVARHVGDIRRAHAHLLPGKPLPPLPLRRHLRQGLLLEVVVVADLLELGQHRPGVLEGPV